jgi:hypothetical protein
MVGNTVNRTLRRGGALPAAAAGVGMMLMVSPTATSARGNPPLFTPGLLLGSALFVVGVGLLLGGHRPRRTDTEV